MTCGFRVRLLAASFQQTHRNSTDGNARRHQLWAFKTANPKLKPTGYVTLTMSIFDTAGHNFMKLKTVFCDFVAGKNIWIPKTFGVFCRLTNSCSSIYQGEKYLSWSRCTQGRFINSNSKRAKYPCPALSLSLEGTSVCLSSRPCDWEMSQCQLFQKQVNQVNLENEDTSVTATDSFSFCRQCSLDNLDSTVISFCHWLFH